MPRACARCTHTQVIDGKSAFFLYDSMGFPLDLTELMAREAGLAVDADGFKAAMEVQRAKSAEAAKAAKGGDAGLALGAEQTAFLVDSGVPFTDDELKLATKAEPSATLLPVQSALLGPSISVTSCSSVDAN